MGISFTQVDNKSAVTIPAEIEAALWGEYRALLGKKNTLKSRAIVDETWPCTADELRDYVRAFGAKHGKSVYIPVHVPAHTVERTDKATGKIEKKTVPANNVRPGTNEGNEVLFRITDPKVKDESGPDTSTVTVTRTDAVTNDIVTNIKDGKMGNGNPKPTPPAAK